MAKVKISEFNSNPALNTDIDSINLAEGCAPSGINDAIRELMAQLKDWQSGTSNDPYVVGSSGSLTLNQGTANTVPYLNGSKVVTSGTALSFDGSNLGLGVTPSAWANSKAFDIGGFGALSTDTLNDANTSLSWNAYATAFNAWKYKNTGSAASRYTQEAAKHIWYTAASGTAGNAITFTQAMTLDASGNLGVGATSMSTTLELRKVGADTKARFNDSVHYWDIGHLTSPNAFAFAYDGSEKARIDSSGNLLVGTTSNLAIAPRVAIVNSNFGLAINTTNGGSNEAVRFYNAGTAVGTITTTGSLTTYNATSDYRLKNITGNLTGYKERVMSLQPKQGTWISDGSEFRGFLAHEFAEPYRASVTGEKDAVDENGNAEMQAMQASSPEVIADLVAHIQNLETRLAALEGA